MSSDISEGEARFALSAIEQRRQQVIAQINVPSWYWWTVAAGWIGLGVLADYGPAWATIAATVAFGAVHSAVAPRVISGRHGSSRLSVRPEVAGRRVAVAVLAFLVVMVVVTIGIALWLAADGARHPAALAGVMVAALVLSAGPGVVAVVRRRVERHVTA